MYTKTTLAMFAGKTPERDMTDNRRLNPRKKSRANNTEPARTRPGATYPGGKAMRRSLANLARRTNDYNTSKDQESLTKPGSR